MFEFPEYQITIEAKSLEAAKAILKTELESGNVKPVQTETSIVNPKPKTK